MKSIFLSFLILFASICSAVSLSPVLNQRFFSSNGAPLAGGKLYSYAAGTSTPIPTYTDSTGAVQNPNPVVLDANGYAEVWMTVFVGYKFALFDASNNPQWTVDGVFAAFSPQPGTSPLPISSGGTGQTTAPNAINALLPSQTGNSGKFLTTNGTVSSWITAPGTGTVTSVAFVDLTNLFNVTGTPITSAGTLTLSSFQNQPINTFFAGPTVGIGPPTFRAIVAADVPTLNQNTTGTAAAWTTPRLLAGNSVDGTANVPFSNKFIVQGTTDAGLSGAQFLGALGTGIVKNTTTTGVLSIAVAGDFPTLNQNTTGTASNITASSNSTLTTLSALSLPGSQVTGNISGNAANVTGTVTIAHGGTGQTTQQAALNAIAGNTTLSQYLRGDGTNVTMSFIAAGDVPTLNQNTTGTASNITASSNTSLTSLANLATVGTITTGVWNGTATAGSSFLTSGTTYTTPSNVTSRTTFKFTLVGGGGGGGGDSTAGGQSAGGGGGDSCIVFLTGLAASTGYTMAIGASGTGGTNAPTTGGGGGNTTISINATTYTAVGGAGGATSNGAAGGAGGTGTNCTIDVPGTTGGAAAGTNSGLSGNGGDTLFGKGGASLGTAGAGNNGTGHGSGGGGARGATAGGNGTAGMILVEWSN